MDRARFVILMASTPIYIAEIHSISGYNEKFGNLSLM